MPELPATKATVVLFGATGFIGTNLVRHLRSTPTEIIPISVRGQPVLGIPTHAMSTLDSLAVPPDAVVINLAAHRYDASRFGAHQGEILANNSALASAVYGFCLRNRITEVRQASSIAVYGASITTLDDRTSGYPLAWGDDPFPSEMMYGWSKRITEVNAHLFRQKHGINTISFRLTNPYGPHDSTDGEAAHVVPAFILRALGTTGPFTVRGNSAATRDFIHVDDVCRVIALSLGMREICRCYNLGTGTNTSIATLAQTVLRLVGSDRPLVASGSAISDVLHRQVIIDSLRSDFPTADPFRSLDDGLADTISWYRSIRA